MRTHLIENYQGLRDSAPCLSRVATLPKATKLGLGRGAHLKTPSSADHTVAASQPTGRIAKAASWLHLSRVSPALHPPERPSHTHTPKPGFGGRGHEVVKCVLCKEDSRFASLYLSLCGRCLCLPVSRCFIWLTFFLSLLRRMFLLPCACGCPLYIYIYFFSWFSLQNPVLVTHVFCRLLSCPFPSIYFPCFFFPNVFPV